MCPKLLFWRFSHMSKGTEFPFRAPITKMLGQQDCSGGRYCPLCCAVPDRALLCVLGDVVSVLLDDVGVGRAAFPRSRWRLRKPCTASGMPPTAMCWRKSRVSPSCKVASRGVWRGSSSAPFPECSKARPWPSRTPRNPRGASAALVRSHGEGSHAS